jgi:capsid protein
LAGRLDLPSFEVNPSPYFAVNWSGDPLDYVDPLKDVEATVLEINSGLRSRRSAISERGGSIEEVDAEIAADRVREASLGLDFRPQPVAPPAQPPEPKP